MSDFINFKDEFQSRGVDVLPEPIAVGAGDYELIEYSVSVTDELKIVSEALAMGVNVRFSRDLIQSQDVERMLTYLVELRCLQVRKRLPSNIHSRDVLVPNFFFPFIARVAVIDQPLMSRTFTPAYHSNDSDEHEDAQDGVKPCEGDLTLNKKVEFVTKIAYRLKQGGVRIDEGLPKIISSSDDGILRIFETEEGELRAAGGDPATTDLLIRSVIRIGFIPECFGAARTRYSRIEDFRNCLFRIVDSAYRQMT